MERKQLIRFLLLLLVSCLSFGQGRLVLGCSDGNCPGQAQIDWLCRQQDLHNSGLVQSYERVNDVNAWIFDQALAIIAFTEANEPNRARRILDKMKEIQRDDPNGAWFECYNAPDACYAGCWKYITGPIAWMVMAVNFYECRTGDPNYALMARRALGWLDTMRNTSEDERYGSLRYCENCSIPNAISTEHNLDAYSAYYWRGILDANDSYLNKASLILNYLRREMWAPSPNSNCCRNINVFCRGYNDCEVATDCQSWGVLSLGPIGPDGEQFHRSLCWLLNPNDSTRTVQDYNESITDVNGFRGCPGDNNYIEVDFTEHVAAAFYSIGDDVTGDFFHNQMGRIVDSNGGLVHSFSSDYPNDPNVECRYNYVASVAWFYFNEVKINPFVLPTSEQWARRANLNKGGPVNFYDFQILASDWLKSGPDLSGDINGGSLVGYDDLEIFVRFWLCGCYE